MRVDDGSTRFHSNNFARVDWYSRYLTFPWLPHVKSVMMEAAIQHAAILGVRNYARSRRWYLLWWMGDTVYSYHFRPILGSLFVSMSSSHPWLSVRTERVINCSGCTADCCMPSWGTTSRLCFSKISAQLCKPQAGFLNKTKGSFLKENTSMCTFLLKPLLKSTLS